MKKIMMSELIKEIKLSDKLSFIVDLASTSNGWEFKTYYCNIYPEKCLDLDIKITQKVSC